MLIYLFIITIVYEIVRTAGHIARYRRILRSGYSTDNAWRICSSWSGKCAIYPFNEWKHEGDTFYHRKDPTRFLRVNKWSYRVTEVKVGADGQLVE